MIALMEAPGVTEIILILAVILLLFGGRKIPELMKGLGSGIREFKKAAKDDQPVRKDPVSTDPIDPASTTKIHKEDE